MFMCPMCVEYAIHVPALSQSRSLVKIVSFDDAAFVESKSSGGCPSLCVIVSKSELFCLNVECLCLISPVYCVSDILRLLNGSLGNRFCHQILT